VLTYGAMVAECEAAVRDSGIDAEILDLRCLDLEGMDWPMIEASIQRTNRVLIAEQTAHGTAHGARWVDEIQARCFDWLDAEIVRVSGSRAAPVVSRPLNEAALAGAAKVAEGLRRLMR
jgi:2-oxoisovalerate dehydrogenase E1 component